MEDGGAAWAFSALDEREQSSHPTQKTDGTLKVLNIDRMNDDAQQEPSVSTRMCPLRPLIFLPVAGRIEPSPPS